jgi:hypothetical protein
VYRIASDFRKVKTPTFVMPDGSEAAVEFLAEGQQFVAFGQHPTGKPYQWVGQSPADVPVDELPLVDLDAVEAFVECAAQVLRDHGGVPKQAKGNGKAKSVTVTTSKGVTGSVAPVGDNYFANVNSAALANPEPWVRPLFSGKARLHPGPGAYRIRSEDLGRDLEEDISIHPDGAWDFGLEKPVSPIDLVIEHGGAADAIQAARWICEKLRIDPATLGWSEPKPKPKPEPQDAEDTEADEDNEPKPKQNRDWYSLCQVSTKGTPLVNLANILLALRLDPAWDGVLRYDEMARVIMLMKPIPKIPAEKTSQKFTPRPWQDNDVTTAQEWFQLAGLRNASRENIYHALDARARENAYHPVREYLDSLTWDKTPRLVSWLSKYIGTEDTAYTQAIGKMFLISAVARIYDPGCKCDYMLILEGDQGACKSTACKILGGDWFSDSIPDNVASKDASQHIRGKWMVEFGEMHAMGKSETTALKAFLTRPVEIYRPSYGRADVYEPRQCVFIGTTNRDDYLTDETGARRFWPVRVGEINIDALIKDRDQLFAEAVQLYRNGEPWYPSREFEAEHIKPQQEARYDTDIWDETIMRWLNSQTATTLSNGMETVRATPMDIARLALSLDIGRVGRAETNRIRKILTSHGWHKDGPRGGDGERYWYPPQFPRQKK